jgi:D-glycero-D-manno-heptose 1,7-bisphosphate phosphatase
LAPADPSYPTPGKQPISWVFLDRDGTLNVKPEEGRYVERPLQLELLPGAAEAVRLFNQANVWTGVVTNQRGVARGHMSALDVDAVHERLSYLLGLEGAALDAVYTWPHEAGACDCRKPEPGMLLAAQREQPGLDFSRAAIVGDSPSDIQAGQRLNLLTVRVAGNSAEKQPVAGKAPDADWIVPDLLTAARLLLGERRV